MQSSSPCSRPHRSWHKGGGSASARESEGGGGPGAATPERGGPQGLHTGDPRETGTTGKSTKTFKPDGGFERKGLKDFTGSWRFDEGKNAYCLDVYKKKGHGQRLVLPYSAPRRGIIISTTILRTAFIHTPGSLPRQSEWRQQAGGRLNRPDFSDRSIKHLATPVRPERRVSNRSKSSIFSEE